VTGRVIAKRDGAVGTIVFDSPEKRNAVSLEMWRAVEAALADFAADPDVRVIVLTGAGDKAFVSGADISRFESERASEEAVAEYNRVTERTYTALHDFPKPTIAGIRGACVGGGVNLAVCCDLRIAGESARFAIPAARLSIGYGYGNVARLAGVIGAANAMEMLYTARSFDAAEALRMGLVNRLVPEDRLDSAVEDYATQIAENAPLTVALVKAVTVELRKDPAGRDLERLARMVDACAASDDYVEGRRAFMEKRRPRFTGS
jgi:enoyl-CoA hydratase/carnithine racemase